MTSTLSLVKKRKCSSKELPNVNIYKLSEPKQKKMKNDNSQWNVSVSPEIEVKTFTDPQIFASLEELSLELKKFNRKSSKQKRRVYHLSEPFLTSSLQKCIRDDKYYSKAAVQFLIENDFITNGVNDLLCECLVKYNDLDILNSLKSHQNDVISERMMVQLVKQIIGKKSNSDIQEILLDANFSQHYHNIHSINDIKFLLSLHVEEIQLKQQMRLLSTTQAAVLLQFLRHIFIHISPFHLPDTDNTRNFTKQKVLLWLDSVVTIHMLAFISSPSMKPLVKALQQTINDQKTYYNDLKLLAPCLELYTKHESLPKPTNVKYSIETITL